MEAGSGRNGARGRFAASAAATFTLLAALTSPGAEGVGSLPRNGAGNPSNHAFTAVHPLRVDRVRWKYTGGQHMGLAMPSLDGARVFVQAGAGSVRCLDADTGAHVWAGEGSPHFNYSSSVLAPGDVSVGTSFRTLRAVDAEGRTLWSTDLDASWVHAPPSVAPDGRTVAFGSDAVRLAALDAGTGEVRWRLPGGGGQGNEYAWDGRGRLVVSLSDRTALLEADGTEGWSVSRRLHGLVVAGDRLVAHEGAELLGIRVGDGSELWRRKVPSEVRGLALRADGQSVAAALVGGDVVVLTLDGNLDWIVHLSEKALCPPASALDGEVLVCDEEGVLHLVAEDGRVLRRFATGGEPHWGWGGRPVLAPDGRVYLSHRDALLCLDVAPPDEGVPQPPRLVE